ncbi:MAG: hypothetical protein QOI55_2369 [Actinomycetota bacterium]|nr:hypothetical protein [Actinomycetota bacterium]
MTVTVGFHVTEVVPTPLAIVNAERDTVSDTAWLAVSCPGVNTPTPELAVAAPDQYETLARPIVSFAVAWPVVKSVAVTLAVHALAAPARVSCTVTAPSCALRLPALVGVPLDSVELDGAEMLRVPAPVVVVVVGAAVVVVVGAAVVVVVGRVIVVVVTICADAPIAGTKMVPAISTRGVTRRRRTANSVDLRLPSG